jgi:hypothetical protein
MADGYGDGDPLDGADIAVGVYGLRTFAVVDGQLGSIIKGAGHWQDGVCEAVCLRPTGDDAAGHEAPAPQCDCGIYGALTLATLFGQYPECASRIVAVIAAEGVTFLGTVGLRTAAARVVAYWVSEKAVAERKVCAEGCPNARRFYDLDVMAKVYGLIAAE